MKRLLAIAVILAVTAPMAGVSGAPSPPNSKAFGKSLAEWMGLYWTWALGGDQADHVKHVRFLQLPQGQPDDGSGAFDDPVTLTGSLNVTLKPGTPFVLPVAVWIGETYAQPVPGYDDDPPIDASIFTESTVLVKIDGKPVIDSSTDDLSDFYFGPVYFDSPVMYAEPTSYGAIGAVFVQGIGFVHPPLSAGTHTLTLHSELFIEDYNLGLIFENTWTITVTK